MEAKLKHLEFIQGVISRMATNSFLFKGWAITIAAALSGFAAVNSKNGLLIIAGISTLMFWALDAYYLWLERSFITLYKSVASKDPSNIDFSMQIDKTHKFCGWFKALWSHHLVVFYGSIAMVDLIGRLFLLKGGK